MGKFETFTFALGLVVSGLLTFASVAPVAAVAGKEAPAPVRIAAAPLSGQAL
ncbi:MAG: hypothetical protein ACK4K7_07670 [Allosphingosinicella sp.]|uniref:hypothetical protein n=1 Tax=Allosphingosinicella sp. TaxID=2823234 RepID=UPI0039201EB3